MAHRRSTVRWDELREAAGGAAVLVLLVVSWSALAIVLWAGQP